MLKIKLIRKGKLNSPTFRIAVQEAKSRLSGSVVCELGFFIPSENGAGVFEIDKDLYKTWVGKGAVPTPAVSAVLSNSYSYKKYSQKSKKQEKVEKETVNEQG
jgi:small subunit ribosomal protein S16